MGGRACLEGGGLGGRYVKMGVSMWPKVMRLEIQFIHGRAEGRVCIFRAYLLLSSRGCTGKASDMRSHSWTFMLMVAPCVTSTSNRGFKIKVRK